MRVGARWENQAPLKSTECPSSSNSRTRAGTAAIANDPVTGDPLMLLSSTGIHTLYVKDGTGNQVALATEYASWSSTLSFDPIFRKL
jgi:hypothetical protein